MSQPHVARGRGAVANPPGRFERLSIAVDPDVAEAPPDTVPTEYLRDTTRSVISTNDSPDVPFRFSLNPYRGCEHGCVYCYARPTHEYFGLSIGLDFETKLLVKERAPELLRAALGRASWQADTLALSGVTDPYQPVERTLGITRGCLQVLAECRQPVGLITKGALVARDTDLLAELARHRAVHVAVSVTTLDETLRRTLEPRASSVERRLETMARLAEAGIPTGVMVAPIIPGLTDHEVPRILARAAEAGACFAGYILLRLPHGLSALFEQWLDVHYRARKSRVLSRIADTRGGRLNDARFGTRMRGDGASAEVIARLFDLSRDRAGIPREAPRLSAAAFRRPAQRRPLFDE